MLYTFYETVQNYFCLHKIGYDCIPLRGFTAESVFANVGTSQIGKSRKTEEYDMKLMLCGKGGCGKSTITALLAKEYAREGKRVLVIDCDESNYGLHQQLGMELPKDFTDFVGGKQRVMMLAANGPMNMPPLFEGPMTIDAIPADYLSCRDGILLMAPGKIHVANEGCACAFNIVMFQFLQFLQLSENDVVIMDMEAGIEHFGRGTGNSCDAVLMVVDPSYESLKLSEKIGELCEQGGHPLFYVLNKVTEKNLPVLEAKIAHPEKIACRLPMQEELLDAGLSGDTLDGAYPEIRSLVEALAAV
jgi:CO dehydrogenase maturation factor